MKSLFARYMSGEFEPVWYELHQLGERVREAALHEDALAVASETMRRVRQNIEVLEVRLLEAGWVPSGPGRMVGQPAADITEVSDTFESEVALLPLSVRAFAEQIEAVYFDHLWVARIPRELARS